MKTLRFKKLSILSNKERKARSETIDPVETVVHGGNGMGKSAFIKHLYGSLGADPLAYGDVSNADVQTLNEFSINDEDFTCFRNGKLVAFYDCEKRLLAHFSTSTGAGKFLCEKLGIQVEFPSSRNIPMTPWPASLFMPFYIDQDSGWSQPANAFSGMAAFSNAPRNLMNFHTAIKPKEYYIAEALRNSAKEDQHEQEKNREHFEYAQKALKTRELNIGIEVDIGRFEKEVEKLLAELSRLNEHTNKAKRELSKLQSHKVVLHDEFLLAEATLRELEKDVKFLSKEEREEIPCPTCGTLHENNFSNTFSLMDDAVLCREYRDEAFINLDKVSNDIQAKLKSVGNLQEEQANINNLLSQTKGEVTLRQALEHESKQFSNRVFVQEMAAIDTKVGSFVAEIKGYQKQMKALSSAKRKQEIMDFYGEKLEIFTRKLNTTATDKMKTDIKPVIDATGSDKARKILAYNYAVLHTIQKYSTALFAPIVIDTPNQNEQDQDNINAMIKFAFENRPKNTQFVLGAVYLHEYDYQGYSIIPTEKDSFLQKSQFDEVTNLFKPYIDEYYRILGS